jgi:hypothetical protein
VIVLVRVTSLLKYDPPGGRFAAFVSKLFGKEPNIQVDFAAMIRRALVRCLQIRVHLKANLYVADNSHAACNHSEIAASP